MTAKTTFTGVQTLVFATVLSFTFGAWLVVPQISIIAMSILFSVFYLSVVLFRARVLAGFDAEADVPVVAGPDEFGERYIILSALYQEQNMIGDLVANLDRLRWNRDNRFIYLICEESDDATIRTIRQKDLPPGFELMIVPHGALRTKPRALNYALARVRGDYLVIYDAEDRPHPDQLLEAATRFRHAPKNLVCLQAPLDIDNRN